MLRIERSSNARVIFSLSGRIDAEDVAELQRLVGLEKTGKDLAFDLQDITLVDRDGVNFLASSESEGIHLENCPAYIRQWIDTEKGQSSP